ncbi:MAG: hypothetical protein K0R65_17 [Crocinitomicaceae bacterium]|jgi:hypothetical protein|nr:hypothetical protein [Crocinitomicaceae bacterium]
MNKIFKILILIVGIIVPQLFLSSYPLILIDWFVLAVILVSVGLNRAAAWSMLIQLAFAVTVLYTRQEAYQYLRNIESYYELPNHLLDLVFVLVNVLTIGAVTYLASRIGRRIRRALEPEAIEF